MELKICTFNLRVEHDGDGLNTFSNRKGRVLETIKNENPDLIGFQEALDPMREWLIDSLTDYQVFGCGRNADYRGESTVIAVKRSMFEVVSMNNFWLSFEPDVPATRFGGDQSKCPRICTEVLLKPRNFDKLIRFCNTHLDHKGDTAKLLGITEVMQYLSERPEQFALTGDFNATPDSRAIQVIGEINHAGRKVKDATAGLGPTYHGYGTANPPVKIDYIITDAEPVKSYIVEDDHPDGLYISDHNPVCSIIDF